MSLVVAQESYVTLLNSMIPFLDGCSLALFVAAHTPTSTDTLATYTAIEASFGGYARVPLNAWGAPFLNFAGKAETDHTAAVFTNSSGGPQTVYGVFLVDPTNTLLVFAELDPAAPATLPDGSTYQAQSQFTLKSEF